MAFQVVSLLISLSFGLVFSEPSNKTAQFSSIEPTAENGIIKFCSAHYCTEQNYFF